MQPLLSVSNIEVIYDEVILVLRGVTLDVPEGKIVTLLGPNGAGKSTTLKAISGLLATEDGEISRGSVTYDGKLINKEPAEKIVRSGIVQVMEGRRIIEDMTIEENLRVGAFSTEASRAEVNADIERMYAYFPRLRERKGLAGYLSGGEQQMLAIARALMAKPRLLLLDEPSMGLSPLLVKEVFGIVKKINQQEGITILLVEQNATQALNTCDYGFVMESGKIVMDGTREKLLSNEDIKEFYLGKGKSDEGRSFKNLKSFRRRKRWL